MRNHQWLEKQLDHLLKTYFSDVNLTTPIEIKFGREAKFRFGSIRLVKPKGYRGVRGLLLLARLGDKRSFSSNKRSFSSNKKVEPDKSIITITSMFAREDVPVEVVLYTIGHELSHYAHGFSSTNKRMFRHPHHGGIVNAELTRRGAGHLIVEFKKWLKGYRKLILESRV
ncbi:MAG: hypothetical protein U1C56_00170 [Candidatus Curtissbacteria bacterium]|nr:hypothetical protein [Candidatus Curtissbacteria bacterium]